MIIRIVSPDEYFGYFSRPVTFFDSREFFEVTPPRDFTVRHFVGFDESARPRLGLVAGLRDGEWHAPYSAPFAFVSYAKPQSLERIYDFFSELTTFLGAPLHITLPSDYYDPLMMPKVCGIISNMATKKTADFDYFYPTAIPTPYRQTLERSARKNLVRAEDAGFRFLPTDDISRAYAVIKANREAHDYHLAMSLDQVQATAQVAGGQCFLLSLDDVDVASAIVFGVADGIVQVIYWGDVPGYSDRRPVNLLAADIFEYYRTHGAPIVDVGPSSNNGIPNSGLCRFKESIGCRTSLRYSFTL